MTALINTTPSTQANLFSTSVGQCYSSTDITSMCRSSNINRILTIGKSPNWLTKEFVTLNQTQTQVMSGGTSIPSIT